MKWTSFRVLLPESDLRNAPNPTKTGKSKKTLYFANEGATAWFSLVQGITHPPHAK